MAKEKKSFLDEFEKDPIIKKILKIYENYGLDISNMSEEEFERIRNSYKSKKEKLDKDLEESKKYQGKFTDDIM